MPSDAQRIQKVKLLVEAGYTERVLLSHDIHTKHGLVGWWIFLITSCLPPSPSTQPLLCTSGPLWWSRLCSHSGEYCTQNGRQRHQQRHGHGDTHHQPKELAHLQIELESNDSKLTVDLFHAILEFMQSRDYVTQCWKHLQR